MESMVVREGSGFHRRTWVNHSAAGFTKLMLSWSLDDIFEDPYTDQVEDIPASFESINQYFGSFVYPLREDIRAKLCSSLDDIAKAPFAAVSSFNVSYNLGKNVKPVHDYVLNVSRPVEVFMYDIRVDDGWSETDSGKEPQKTLPGDLVLFSNCKPESVSDLNREGKMWILGLVIFVSDEPNHFNVMVSKEIDVNNLYLVFLVNVLTEKRIWHSLHSHNNVEIIEEVIQLKRVIS